MLARLFRLLASAAVPGGGYLVADWSAATALTLYWIDNVIGGIAMAIRIAEHRRLTNAAGHDRAQLGATMTINDEPVAFQSFFSEFLITTAGFGLAHGLFLAAVLGFVLERPDVGHVRDGAIAIAICHALALGVDRWMLDAWSFGRLKDHAGRVMSRVALVNVALLGGTWFMAFSSSPDAFFTVFVWLKAAGDVGATLPPMATRRPPRVLARVMNLFPKQNGETFEEYWQRTHSVAETQAALDERAKPRRKKRR